MIRKQIFCTLIILFFQTSFVSAQKGKHELVDSVGHFNFRKFEQILLHELNKFRDKHGLDSFYTDETVLVNAAEMSAREMAMEGKTDVPHLSETTPKHLKKAGGTTKGEELVISIPFGKGKNELHYPEAIKQIIPKWTGGKKEKVVLLNPANVYSGLRTTTDEGHKRLFVSLVLGNYQTFNLGAKKRKEMAVPYNKKSKKFMGPDPRKCKTCDKFKDYHSLQQGVYVENGKVYLRYNNLKNLKKLIKKPTDALAIDIIQKEQYSKSDYNIMDNNLQSKGYMIKPVFTDKLFGSNLIKPDPKGKKKQKINKLLVELGKFPKKITGPYELNLLVIQDGYVCKTILRSYNDNGYQESNTALELMPMPESVQARVPPFEPRSESSILNFTIPFEKNKSEFKPEDIQPFITALQEPDFFIDGLYIYAYSSIEGDSVANARLQRRRAESVVKVLQGRQANVIKPQIVTNDSWALFQLSMEDGKYDHLAKMTKREAVRTINTSHSLLEELEPELAKQRFAEIVMDVTYDISGDKEQKFSEIQFNKAVKAENFYQAYKIMDYIHACTASGKYTHSIWDNMQIPDDAKNVGMHMNKIYYDYIDQHKVIHEEHYAEIKKLQSLNPLPIVNFNLLYCKIKLDSSIGDAGAVAEMQTKIDALYKTDLPKKNIDALNIEWQFKVMDALDSVEGAEPRIEACIEKIKSFYDFKSGTWQNALKLAYSFAHAKDFNYAIRALDPFINAPDPDEKLLYAYISIASHVPEKFFSHNFSDALLKAKKKNPEKYCKLFGDPFMSFQVLDNPDIKKEYRNSSCPN